MPSRRRHPRRGVCGTAYGTSRPPVRKESTGEHDGVGAGIGAELAEVTRARSNPHPVAESPCPSCSTGRFQRAKSCKTRCTRHRLASTAARSVLCWRGLLTACGYRVPERHTTTVKRCNMVLDAVLLMSCAYTADGLGCGRIESRDQGGGPTRPAGLRARPSTRVAGMVSQMKAAVARSRPEDRSAAPRDGCCCRLKTYSRRGATT